MAPFGRYKWRCLEGAGSKLLQGPRWKGSQIVSVISGNTLILKDSESIRLPNTSRKMNTTINIRAAASRTTGILPNDKRVDGLSASLSSSLLFNPFHCMPPKRAVLTIGNVVGSPDMSEREREKERNEIKWCG